MKLGSITEVDVILHNYQTEDDLQRKSNVISNVYTITILNLKGVSE